MSGVACVKNAGDSPLCCWAPHDVNLGDDASPYLVTTSSTGASHSLQCMQLVDQSRLENQGTAGCSERITSLCWTPNPSAASSNGIIVGGNAAGTVELWDAQAIIKATDQFPINQCGQQHAGAVLCMGTNPGQPNLLATGSVQSEIFIWDLNKPANSFSPGAKSAPLADVSQLAWNLEVAHILASCSGGPSALIWDLRACEAKFKCTDPSGKMDCQTIAWNPSGHGVQIAMCSANDAFPVVQMWDLRQEKAPLFERQSHDQNGIVAAEWSCREPIRFISASQTGRAVLWDPHVVETQPVEIFSGCKPIKWIGWCAPNPDLVAVSYHGVIEILSVEKGKQAAANATAQATAVQHPDAAEQAVSHVDKPHYTDFTEQPDAEPVVGVDEESRGTLSASMKRLGDILDCEETEALMDICAKMIDENTNTESEVFQWKFLYALLESESRVAVLKLLGFDPDPAESITSTAEMESEQVFSTPSRDNLETAVLIGDWETAVDQCIEANDFGLAFLLATAGGPALYKKAQAAYLKRDGETEFQLLLLIASRRWSDIVKGIPLDQWHKALAVINTYAQGAEEYRSLCEQLGSRLQHDNDGEFRMESIACYMCAGNVDSMIVVIEDMAEEAASAAVLPNVVEKACVLLRTIQLQTPLTAELMDTSIDLFTSKAQLLAANFDRLGGNVVSRKLIGFATNEPMLESDEVFTDLPASANSELQASRVSHESQQQQPSSAVPSQQEMGMPVQRAASASLEPAHGYRGSSESGLMRGASVSSIDVPSHVPRMSSLSEASMHTRTINSKTPTIPEAQEPAQQQPPPNIQSSIQAYQHPQGQSGAQSTPGWSDNTPQGYQNPTSNQASQHNMVAPVAAHDVAAAPSSRGSGPYGVPVPPLNTSVPSSTQQQPSFPNTQPLHNDTHQPQAHGYNYSNPSHTQNAATYNPNVAHSQPAAAYTQNATHSQPVHTGDNTKSWNDPPEVAASQVQKPVYAVPTTITNPLQPASDQTPQASTQYAAQTSTSNTSTTGTAPAPSEGSDFLPQMPDEYQPIVNMLNEKLQICLAQGKQSYKRRLLDAQKKLDPLYKKLAYRQVGDVKFTQMLYDLASSLQSKDYGKASRWQTKLMSIQAQNNDMADIGKSMIGIKAIIHVAKSLGV